MSIISDFSNKGMDVAVIKLRTSNLDYNPSYFFGANRVDADYLINENSKIIIELVDIQFDLKNNAILPGFRLRQMAKISLVPRRVALSEYSFVDYESESASQTTTKISRLSQNYDITQTEYMDDDTEDSSKIVNVSETLKRLASKSNPVYNKPKLNSIKEIYIKPQNSDEVENNLNENNLNENNLNESNSDSNNITNSSSDSVEINFPNTNGDSPEQNSDEDEDDNMENMQDHINKILSGFH
jgi:hypothetical protein